MIKNEFPILFNTEMVRAIQAERKSQTRRIIKPQPHAKCDKAIFDPAVGWLFREGGIHKCPYGNKGAKLWVRETWSVAHPSRVTSGRVPYDPLYIYRADTSDESNIIQENFKKYGSFVKWKPSIYMPRKAARIFLTNEGKRIERLQDISEEDARAEGTLLKEKYGVTGTYRDSFIDLWDSINASPKPIKKKGVITHYESYPWDNIRATMEYRGKPWFVCGNPWVIVINFKKKGD